MQKEILLTRGSSRLVLAAALGAALAGALAIYLLIFDRALPGCGAGSGCAAVAATRWAWWGGSVPVAALGIGAYLALCFVAGMCYVGPGRGLIWGVGVAALAVGGGVLWFVGLQLFWIKHVCGYCMADHALGLIAAGLGIAAATRGGLRAKEWAGMGALAMLGLGTLIAGQVGVAAKIYQVVEVNITQPMTLTTTSAPATVVATTSAPAATMVAATTTAPSTTVAATGPVTTSAAVVVPSEWKRPAPRQVSLLSDQLKFDPGDYPIIGNPDAPIVIVMLFDYTCPHCRKLHPMMLKALERYAPGLAVVEFPIPLNLKCNSAIQFTDSHAEHACEYAQYALAVWKADAGKFPVFDAWMFEGENPPSVEAARKKAEELVGVEAFASALVHEDVAGRLNVGIKVFTALKAGSIPKLLMPQRVVVGETDTAESLYDLLERETGVKVPGK